MTPFEREGDRMKASEQLLAWSKNLIALQAQCPVSIADLGEDEQRSHVVMRRAALSDHAKRLEEMVLVVEVLERIELKLSELIRLSSKSG